MTPTVVRDRNIRFRIVAAAWISVGLTDKTEDLRRQAIYTICHEATHVHHESKWYAAFPDKHGTAIEEPGKIGSLLSAMFSSCTEYAVCHSTAPIRPETAAEYESSVIGAIDYTLSERTTRMRAYLLHRRREDGTGTLEARK